LAHISVELLLKAWLLHAAGKFAGTHHLHLLYDELVRKHGAPTLTAQQSRVLTLLDGYEQLRYPNRNDPTDVGDEDSRAISDFDDAIWRSLPRSLIEDFESVNPLEKGGRVLMKRKIEP
jgi:hypothetical protein